MNDTIADMLTRIQNAQKVDKAEVQVKYSKICIQILNILVEEGYINGYKIIKNDHYSIKIYLKYYNEKPVITKINRISKPGKRIYTSITTLWKSSNGLGLNILSTSKGVLSDQNARRLKVGGEVLCQVF
jgi:small subunit ribosomal protein S8